MHLKTQIRRELDRLEPLLDQIKEAEAERDALLAAPQPAAPAPAGRMLLEFKGIGAELAAVLWLEALFRHFDNRRQLASYAGAGAHALAKRLSRSRAGCFQGRNSRLRTSLIQLAWLWLRHQPQSALTLWFKERVSGNGGLFKKVDHRRARAQAAGGVMGICHRWCRHRRSRDEGCLTIDAQQIIKSPRT